MPRSQFAVYSLLLCLLPWSAKAEDIAAAYGYTLGMPISEVQVLSTKPADYGNTLYVVKPATGSDMEEVLLGTGKDGRQVTRIIGRSRSMPATSCFSILSKTVDRLRQRYPNSGYYALDDSDMLYQEDRNILLSCQEEGEQYRMVIEYRDDSLQK
jgi:hypothetical protein